MNICSESDCDRGHKPSKPHSYSLKEHHLSYEGHKKYHFAQVVFFISPLAPFSYLHVSKGF